MFFDRGLLALGNVSLGGSKQWNEADAWLHANELGLDTFCIRPDINNWTSKNALFFFPKAEDTRVNMLSTFSIFVVTSSLWCSRS